MFCPKCGKQIPDTSRFCGGCGNPVTPLQGGTQKGAKQILKQEKVPKPEKPLKAPKSPKPSKQLKQQGEKSGNNTVLILGIVLAVLVFVAAGMGAYYVMTVRDGDTSFGNHREAEAETETGEEPEISEDGEQEESAETPLEEAAPEEAEEPEEDVVVSDTNEVVAGRILEDIPKALYSYRFDGALDGAETVVRTEPEKEPETTDGAQAQYVHGMDGEAIWLDGNYGLKLSNVGGLGDSYTVAFWIKADELYNWAPFIHVGRNLFDEKERCRLWVGQKPDGKNGSRGPILSSERAAADDSVEIRPDNTDIAELSRGVWYHIAFTVDGSVQGSRSGRVLGKLYLAGTEVGEGDVVVDAMSGDDFDVYLGINCWDQLYPAAFDDVKIWNQALSAEQIAILCEAYE